MFDLLRQWRQARLERRAADWAVRIDEDRDGNEAKLRRWVGQSEERAQAYNQAYRAFHGAASAAQQIYGMQTQREPQMPIGQADGRHFKQVFAIAISLILASAALYHLLARFDFFANGTTDGRVLDRVTTHIGEVRPVRLADGSRLLLDTDSEIRLDFSASARKVEMVRGRARFAVAHDPKRPFSVTVDGATITDRGTVFDVEAYRCVRVRLISGVIDVAFRKPARGNPAPPLHLIAGQQVRFDPALTIATGAPTATPPSDAQWVSGMKTFDDVPVSEILEEVNRYSPRSIVLADPSLGTHRVFLDLDIRDAPSVAENLAIYLHLTVDTSKPSQLILREPKKSN